MDDDPLAPNSLLLVSVYLPMSLIPFAILGIASGLLTRRWTNRIIFGCGVAFAAGWLMDWVVQ